MTVNRTAMTGERIFVCDWSERKSVAPLLGDEFPGEPWLKCSNLEIEGIGKPGGSNVYAKARIVASYSTYQWIDDVPIESWEIGGEVLETAIGRVWASTGYYCEQAYGVFYPSAIRTITLTFAGVPVAAIFNNMGKVNGNWFLDIPPYYALFEGASITAHFAPDLQQYIYKVSYKFNIRAMSWNTVWRAPQQARDDVGNLKFDAGGFPVWEPNGGMGVGGWDSPYPWLYDFGDFGPMMGLPSMPIIYPPKPPQGGGFYLPYSEAGIGGKSRITI